MLDCACLLDDAIMAYLTLGKTVFGQKQKPWKDGRFSAKALEVVLFLLFLINKRQKQNDF
jgi:hypothetical protein